MKMKPFISFMASKNYYKNLNKKSRLIQPMLHLISTNMTLLLQCLQQLCIDFQQPEKLFFPKVILFNCFKNFYDLI